MYIIDLLSIYYLLIIYLFIIHSINYPPFIYPLSVNFMYSLTVIIYLLFTHYLPFSFIYLLSTHYLSFSFIYSLSIIYLIIIYHLSNHYLSFIYSLSIIYLLIIYLLSCHYLSIISISSPHSYLLSICI